MPTGYTCIIEDNENVTLRDYILRCARAMGPCVMQRDEHLSEPPKEQKPSQYHANALQQSRDRLADIRAMTDEQIAAECEKEYHNAEQSWRDLSSEDDKVAARYEAMRATVLAWEPPTTDHDGLKQFMLEQIDESRRFGESLPPPKRRIPAEWKSDAIARAERDIVYHSEKYAADIERAESRNAWIRSLMGALPEPVPVIMDNHA